MQVTMPGSRSTVAPAVACAEVVEATVDVFVQVSPLVVATMASAVADDELPTPPLRFGGSCDMKCRVAGKLVVDTDEDDEAVKCETASGNEARKLDETEPLILLPAVSGNVTWPLTGLDGLVESTKLKIAPPPPKAAP